MVYGDAWPHRKQQLLYGNSMHRALAAILVFEAPFATAICVLVATIVSSVPVSEPLRPFFINKVASNVSLSGPSQPPPVEGESLSGEEDSDPRNILVSEPNRSADAELHYAADQNGSVDVDRDYLVETAIPGDTMTRQGPELAIGRLHPEFVRRLAGAIREARKAGLSNTGIFSAYRPPAFGIGGFSDKFNSLHTYGLAVDMSGIGGPGSDEAKLWHEIAVKHGVVCPYGFANHVEWNHCQPTRIKIILDHNSLRETVTADGPINLASMFEAGNSYIERPEEVADFVSFGATEPETSAHGNRPDQTILRIIKVGHLGRPGREPPSWCRRIHRYNKEACGSSHQIETAARTKGVHPRQAS
jgi:hypothetical protein